MNSSFLKKIMINLSKNVSVEGIFKGYFCYNWMLVFFCYYWLCCNRKKFLFLFFMNIKGILLMLGYVIVDIFF